MTPAARVQAAIEIVDMMIASVHDDGAPADALVRRYFQTRRYAGSKDRRAVRELAYRAIRHSPEAPPSGRAAMLGLSDPEIEALFGNSPHGPAPIVDGEPRALAGLVPAWLTSELSSHVTPDEYPALLGRAPLDLRVNAARGGRAPLDLRVNAARGGRDAMTSLIDGAAPTALSPWGLRLPADTRVDDHPAFIDGRIEIQDEGNQLIALACRAAEGQRILDMCAGAGGKALALAAAAPGATIIASDTNRARLSQLAPRAERAGANIATLLLDAGRETAQLAELGQFDTVLVDAPCSGSGTWRRNPEGRWRLTPARLDRLGDVQAKLLDFAAPLVRPGGSLVYATCSILVREGKAQVEAFLGRHSGWDAQDPLDEGGRRDGPGRLLTPGHDHTDGFFVARLVRPC